MGRSRTAIGTHGTVTTLGYADSGRKVRAADGVRALVWVARTRYRDTDGTTRLVEASGATRAKAETALKGKLADRRREFSNNSLRSGLRVADAATYWLSTLDRVDLSDGTRSLYAGNVRRYLHAGTIANLTLAEVNNVATLERWMKSVADTSGNGAVKSARSVLSNVLGLAVRYGVLPHNALRDAKTPRSSSAKVAKRDPDRVFTPEELAHVLTVADENATSIKYDMADLTHFLAGTGVRINEALTLRWEDVDLASGQVHIRGTKTEFSDRHLHMSASLTERLSKRLAALRVDDLSSGTRLAGTGVVFHSPGTADREKPRNRDNTVQRFRRIFDAAGAEWATSHTFRHGVITKIVEAGHDIGLAADQAGHSDLRTTTAYIGRKRDTRALADVL